MILALAATVLLGTAGMTAYAFGLVALVDWLARKGIIS
jgi:hypothetical protein